jgi:hypothetical protein
MLDIVYDDIEQGFNEHADVVRRSVVGGAFSIDANARSGTIREGQRYFQRCATFSLSLEHIYKAQSLLVKRKGSIK